MFGEFGTMTIILVVFLLIGSAFFSSSETAFLSLQRVRLQYLAESGSARAKLIVDVLGRPGRLLTTILLGNNLVNIAFASVMTVMIEAVVGPQWSVVAATVIVTAILLVVGEITPKTIALRHAERVALLYIFPMRFLIYLFTPLTAPLGLIALRADENRQAVGGEEEIRSLVTTGVAEGVIEEEEAELVERMFRFGDHSVSEVLTPRREIVWVQEGTTFAQFLAVYLENAHTRFPVYQDDVDNVVGVLSVKDVLQARAADDLSENSVITHLIRQPLFVPETKGVWGLFNEMRSARNQFALAVDEHGTIAGLVTLKGLVENIVGPVDDEGEPRISIQTIGQETFQVEGAMIIEEANESMSLEIPEGEYNTIAGFVLSELGHIPDEGETVEYNEVSIMVEQMQGRKIESLIVKRRN